jgi:hypothetical protein
MKRLLWMAFGFLLLVNLAVLSHGFYNRQAAETRITLSERELNLPGNYGFNKENSGLTLSLSWSVAGSGDDVDDFTYNHRLNLPPEHYASFGFGGECDQHRNRSATDGYVLLEFNGATYQRHLELAKKHLGKMELEETASTEKDEYKVKSANERLRALEQQEPRLYVVDAAASKALLQTALTYRLRDSPGEYLILPALIRDSYRDCDVKEAAHGVHLDKLLAQRIYVPREYHSLFVDRNHKHRFHADIAVGKLGEPWLESLQICDQQCEQP